MSGVGSMPKSSEIFFGSAPLVSESGARGSLIFRKFLGLTFGFGGRPDVSGGVFKTGFGSVRAVSYTHLTLPTKA